MIRENVVIGHLERQCGKMKNLSIDNDKRRKPKRKYGNVKRLLAVGMMLALTAGTLAGCGKGGTDGLSDGQDSAKEEDEATGISGGGEAGQDMEAAESGKTAMGRYVETTVELPESATRSYTITALTDGRLLVLDEGAGQLISSDGGASWETVPIPGIDNMKAFTENNYIFSMAAAPDGTVAVLSSDNAEYDKTEEFNPWLHIAKPDGTVKKIDSLPVQENESFAYGIFYSPEGELFATTVGGGMVYRVDVESGALTKEVTMEWRPDLVKCQGDNMFFLTSREGISIYDRKEEKWVEDSVLADFMEENYKDVYYANESYSVYMMPGEDGAIYLAGKGGMYRHVIGGSVMEQIIDGALTSFSNPSMNMIGVTAYGENEFAALFSGGKVALYKYDPNVSTVPENMISVYSLEEHDAVRQAIAQFQTENPDTFVRYEVGVSGLDAKAAEDAIKKLNTELMAGKGPDVIIMDGLPVKSYEEKGILKDLKPHIDSLSGDAVLLPNIVEAFNHEGSVYMMPVYFQIPMVIGRQDDLSGITDLASLKDTVEKIKAEKPEAEICRFFFEEATVRWLLPVAATAFIGESGGIDGEALSAYLSAMDQISKTALEGIPDFVAESYGWQKDYYKEEKYAYEHFNDVGLDYDDFMVQGMELNFGMLKDVYAYQSGLSLKYCEGFEDVDMKFFDGMSEGAFEPSVLVGLSASSTHQEDAERFFDIIMGTQVQSLLYDGFMVNQTALQEQLSNQWKIFKNGGTDKEYGEPSSSVGGSYDDGREFHMDIYMPTQEEFQKLYALCSQVKTPYVADTVVENAVIEVGAQYLQGQMSLDEAVQKIKARVELYMAE